MYLSSYQCFVCHYVWKTLTFHYPAIEDSMRKLKIDPSMKVNSINVGIQADNGSVIYYIPGYQAGYTPYGPLLPGAMYGVDGQFLNQSYCPSPISPQALVSPGPLPQQVAYGPELMPAYPWDPSFFFADEIQGSRFSVDQTKPHYRPNLSSDGHTLAPSSTFPASKSAFGTKGSSPVSDLSHSTMIHNQTQKPVKKVIHFVFICSASILSDWLLGDVNASGQFCGVAEMTGRVDFSKNMDFWQQDKWNGFFPVKWHIIKDVPNLQFRHIILENNDNKPVTNSRDTQEVCLLKQFSLFDNYDALFYALEKVKNLNPWQVKFSQGTELLSSFKSYSSKTSILDDFGFYENRQKAMQDKRNKPTTPPLVNSLVKPSYILSVSRLLIFNPKNVESTEVPKLGDSKSQPPNLVSVEVKEGLQTGIASRK
ncbi:hypothetical protein BHE74_00018916 [Ensete ventricosum]|nr:hypothetical protein BHE74_00018916 [Ensete ventricosum]